MKKEKRKQQHLPYDIKVVGKNIKLGRGEGTLKCGKENKDFKNEGGAGYRISAEIENIEFLFKF